MEMCYKTDLCLGVSSYFIFPLHKNQFLGLYKQQLWDQNLGQEKCECSWKICVDSNVHGICFSFFSSQDKGLQHLGDTDMQQ